MDMAARLKNRAFIRRAVAAASVAALLAIAAAFSIRATRGLFVEFEGGHLKGVVADLANNIDATTHSTLQNPTDNATAAYAAISDVLAKAQRQANLKSAYTLRVSDGQVFLVVAPSVDLNGDGRIEGFSEERKLINTPYSGPPTPEMLGAAIGRRITPSDGIRDDHWGEWMSACAPLLSYDGSIEGAVCVDEDARPLLKKLRRVYAAIIGAYVLIGALIWAVAHFRNRAEGMMAVISGAELRRQRVDNMCNTIFDSTPLVAMQGFSREGIISRFNRASEQLYGIPREKAIGRKVWELLVEPGKRDFFRNQLDRMIATKQPVSVREWISRSADGREMTLMSTMVPVVFGGELMEVICMDVDISREKAYQADLQRQIAKQKELQESMIKREGRVIELKKEINDLLVKFGQEPKYVV
jgi:PAS domain S-box-containing protein